jgi:hypothetical protein
MEKTLKYEGDIFVIIKRTAAHAFVRLAAWKDLAGC